MNDLSRRRFLNRMANACLGVGALGLTPSLSAIGAEPGVRRRPTAKNVIMLYMAGGMSHLDTFDPKPGTAEQGALQAIPTSVDGMSFGQHLPLLAAQAHRLTLLRSMTSTQGAHEQGEYFMRTGFVQRGGIRHPSLGAWISHSSPRINPTLPASVVLGGGGQHPGAGFFTAAHAPLPLGDPAAGLPAARPAPGIDDERFRRRLALADALDAGYRAGNDQPTVRAYGDLYREACALMDSPDLAAFDLTKEPEALRDRYGEDRFGQGCLLARRLVENDVRCVEVVMGGWDTHDDHAERIADQCAILDQGASALIADLAGRGLLDETLVILATEFGRTPTFNERDGRDHYPKAFSCWLAGGGVRGGHVHGATDARGATATSAPVQVQDLHATAAHALGLARDEVLSPAGRPFRMADKGTALTSVFA
ncbi:MAG TPA: DUF1501 domain-containing protein [Planctomycetota bacterium]|nr:DUF1501 domain-containing protein [Planctomycetota bacterium]